MALPPWKNPSKRPASGRKLTPESIAWAKARARKAGRRYPNLVDNMAAAQRQAEAERGEENGGGAAPGPGANPPGAAGG